MCVTDSITRQREAGTHAHTCTHTCTHAHTCTHMHTHMHTLRYDRYERLKREIEEHESSLKEFALGYKRFGFNTSEQGIVYKEWAPAAKALSLTGDFCGWDRDKHPATCDDFGVWTVVIPNKADGAPGIPEGSFVKVRTFCSFCQSLHAHESSLLRHCACAQMCVHVCTCVCMCVPVCACVCLCVCARAHACVCRVRLVFSRVGLYHNGKWRANRPHPGLDHTCHPGWFRLVGRLGCLPWLCVLVCASLVGWLGSSFSVVFAWGCVHPTSPIAPTLRLTAAPVLGPSSAKGSASLRRRV